nr:unnamed protein product [Callosobruchus analis]
MSTKLILSNSFEGAFCTFRMPYGPFHLFFDNYFTSLSLLKELGARNMKGTGTIRENRIPECPLKRSSDLKVSDRGTFDYSLVDDDIVICKWNDNSVYVIIQGSFTSKWRVTVNASILRTWLTMCCYVSKKDILPNRFISAFFTFVHFMIRDHPRVLYFEMARYSERKYTRNLAHHVLIRVEERYSSKPFYKCIFYILRDHPRVLYFEMARYSERKYTRNLAHHVLIRVEERYSSKPFYKCIFYIRTFYE